MDIYKLSDFEKGNKKLVFDASGSDDSGSRQGENKYSGELVITGLKAGVKNPERVNVYVNKEFLCSLDVAQVVELAVKVGRVVTVEELEELKKASECGKLYQRTLEWVLLRPRSRREVYDYLCKKIYEKKIDKGYIEQIIKRLEEKKYIDDFEFARWYVENRLVKKGVSQKRLQMELMKKGVSREIIDEVLDGRDEREEIRKMIEKKQAKYDDSQKLMAYLCRQGFSYDLVKELVEENN